MQSSRLKEMLFTFACVFKKHGSINYETIEDNGSHGKLQSEETPWSTKSYPQQKKQTLKEVTENQESAPKDLSDVSINKF